MATTDKLNGNAPVGQSIVVREELRVFVTMQLGFMEVEKGWFKKALPEGEGTLNIDFRPTGKNVNGHPKGRLYVRLEDGKYLNDEISICEKYEAMAHYRLFQQKIWADKDLDGNAKKTSHEENIVGDIENPVKEEIKVGSQAKPAEPAREPEVVSGGVPVAKQEIPAGKNLPSAPASRNMPLANKNAFTAITVNEIEIPNEYIVLYAKKDQSGKIVGYSPYILEKGLEFLAGKMGLWVDPRAKDPEFPADQLVPAIDVVPVKMPGTENEWGGKGDVVFKGIVRMANGQVFTDYGTATSKNLNQKQQKYPIEMAITRAKARALRDATHCNVCSLEEADLDPKQGDIIDAEFTIVTGGGN